MVTQTDHQKKTQDFFSSHPQIRYKKRDTLLWPEDPIESIFFLTDGYVRMYSVMPDGKELTLNIFKTGSFFPLFIALEGVENRYFYQAMSPVVVRKAPKQHVIDYVTSNGDVLYDFTRRITSGFHGLLTNLQYQLFGTVHRKICSTLVLLVRRFGMEDKHGITIPISFTHQDIADLTGVARETASVELSALQKQGLIRYSGRTIIIPDITRLEQEVYVDNQPPSNHMDL